MKQILVINPHSFIDVITNSSTELFVCDTDKSIEMVNEILQSNSELYGFETPWVFDINKYREWRKEVRQKREDYLNGKNEVVDDSTDWDNPFHSIEGWFNDTEDEEDLKHLREQFIENGDMSANVWRSSTCPFKERLKEAEESAVRMSKHKLKDDRTWNLRYNAKKAEINKIYDEIEKSENKPHWWVNPHLYSWNKIPAADLHGKVIILGEDDNSIPYEQFDWIEDTFNALRYHLG